MKPLLVSLIFSVGTIGLLKKPVGPCQPYAEKCLHCTDCSQCKHCAVDKGRCSVCFHQ